MELSVVFFFIVYIVFYAVMLGIGVASYIMQALGLQRIAKRTSVSKPWLAWFPVGHEWLLGLVADGFDREKGLNRKWRVALLVSSILTCISIVIFYVVIIAMSVIPVLFKLPISAGIAIVCFVGMFVGMLVLMLAATALNILSISCLFKIYDEIIPKKALKYLLLSFLVPLAKGICLLRAGKQYAPEEKAVDEELLLEDE